jgi:PAS domain-containing protein
MGLPSRLNFQTKIDLVTFVMALLVVISGAIAIERPLLPAMERDACAEAWMVAEGVREQVQEYSMRDGEAELNARLSFIFQVLPKLLYVDLLIFAVSFFLTRWFTRMVTRPDGIIANDRHGRTILYNSGAERLLQCHREEALRKFSVRRIYPDEEAHAIKKSLLSDELGGYGVLPDYTSRAVGKNGETIPIRLSATIHYEGEIIGPLAEEQAIMGEAIYGNLDRSMEMLRHHLDLSRIEKDEMSVQPRPTPHSTGCAGAGSQGTCRYDPGARRIGFDGGASGPALGARF